MTKIKTALNKQKILQLLSEQREEIRKYSVKSLGLFGSAIREEMSDESDVDILVELKDETFDNYMDLKFYLENLFHREVDLVPKDCVKPRLKQYIFAEALDVPGF